MDSSIQAVPMDETSGYFLIFVGNKAKGRISKRVFQESKARQNFRKKTLFLLNIVKQTLFFGNFGELCFLETPVLRFALLPYSRRIIVGKLLLRCFLIGIFPYQKIHVLMFSSLVIIVSFFLA